MRFVQVVKTMQKIFHVLCLSSNLSTQNRLNSTPRDLVWRLTCCSNVIGMLLKYLDEIGSLVMTITCVFRNLLQNFFGRYYKGCAQPFQTRLENRTA